VGLGESFDEFAAARWPTLVRAGFLLVGDWHHAEDLAQLTLVKVWRHWGRVSAADDPERYVRKMLVNEFLRSRGRNRRHEPLTDDSVTAGHVSGPDDPAVERDALRRALAHVPERQRLALVLRFYLDLSERDTAAALGCSIGTVKSQTARGLASLRGAYGGAPRGLRMEEN